GDRKFAQNVGDESGHVSRRRGIEFLKHSSLAIERLRIPVVKVSPNKHKAWVLRRRTGVSLDRSCEITEVQEIRQDDELKRTDGVRQRKGGKGRKRRDELRDAIHLNVEIIRALRDQVSEGNNFREIAGRICRDRGTRKIGGQRRVRAVAQSNRGYIAGPDKNICRRTSHATNHRAMSQRSRESASERTEQQQERRNDKFTEIARPKHSREPGVKRRREIISLLGL